MTKTAASNVKVRTSTRSSDTKISYTQGQILDITGNVATVRLVTGLQVRARADLPRGKSAAPQVGEQWLLDQIYGQWLFAVPLGYSAPAIGKYATTVGDGTTTTFVLTHGLGTQDVLVQAYNPLTGALLTPSSITRTDQNDVSVAFASPPATGAARIVVLG